MLHLYYSNLLDYQKTMLIKLLQLQPQQDPFRPEIIVVQSAGMAQWLNIEIAKALGISCHIQFLMAGTFIWQQYNDVLVHVSPQDAFRKEAMRWHLIELIQQNLDNPYFVSLKNYLAGEQRQQKCFQLANKIASLFDQYLVYRPHWIQAWEQHQENRILAEFQHYSKNHIDQNIKQDVYWQGILWRSLLQRIQQHAQHSQDFPLKHRAELQQDYFMALKKTSLSDRLVPRIFIFGIAALPETYLQHFQALAQQAEVHLFFNNPCMLYWGDIVDESYQTRLTIQSLAHSPQTSMPTNTIPHNVVLHPLLASWGKLGRDFLSQLTEIEHKNEITAYDENPSSHLLAQLQNQILQKNSPQSTALFWQEDDLSICIKSCHNLTREVEVLQDHLLHLLAENPDLTPKDIMVMSPNIEDYAPYIQAVFGQVPTQDSRYLPFSISDRVLTQSNHFIMAFMQFLTMKDSTFSAETLLNLLEIPFIYQQFEIEYHELIKLRQWVAEVGIRCGLEENPLDTPWKNFNAWQAGIERLLMGSALTEEQGVWQNTLGFDASYGLTAQSIGKLAHFLEHIQLWHQFIHQSHCPEQWHARIQQLLTECFIEQDGNESILLLNQLLTKLFNEIDETHFNQPLPVEVIHEAIEQYLEQEENKLNLNFLVGKLNFSTLTPMRAIPFKVICLLGMNEGDFPRQQIINSFDLMHYQVKKGDRSKRDDDRYLFLEALLSAQQQLYISYIGQSIIDNQVQAPSVLVSQLLDYLSENITSPLSKETRRQNLVQPQAMQIFSPRNFQGVTPSYAKEWLITPTSHTPKPFFQNIANPLWQENSPFEYNVSFHDFSQFVCHPLKYFFERQLHINLNNRLTEIAETENFTLEDNYLERYRARKHYLYSDPNRWTQQTEIIQHQGILPMGEFAHLAIQQTQELIKPLNEQILPYLQPPPQQQIIECEIDLPSLQHSVILQGVIGHIYANQHITWHAGRYKDQHLIELWLIYLIQKQHNPSTKSPIKYFLDKTIAFADIDAKVAYQQLQQYMEAYLTRMTQPFIVVTENIAKFLRAENEEMQLKELESLILDNSFHSPDPYWQRLLQQPHGISELMIYQHTKNWFKFMLDSQISPL